MFLDIWVLCVLSELRSFFSWWERIGKIQFPLPSFHNYVTKIKRWSARKKNCIENHTFCKNSARNSVDEIQTFPRGVKSYAFLQEIIVFSYSFFAFSFLSFTNIIFIVMMTKPAKIQGQWARVFFAQKFAKRPKLQIFSLDDKKSHVSHLTWHYQWK